MIVGPELGAWKDDRKRQGAAREAADRIAQCWNTGQVHARFARRMAALRDRRCDTVVQAVRELFADDGWMDTLISTLADGMRADPFVEPPFRHLDSAIHRGLIVYEDDNVAIAVGVSGIAHLAARKGVRRRSGAIAFSGQVGVLKFVRAGGARLAFWEAPRIGDDFTMAQAGRCRKIGEREINDGEIITVDGRFESFIIERADANLLIMQATVKPDQAPLAVEYDSGTFEQVGCSAADDGASRIQMIATLLRKLGAPGGFDAISNFIDHSNFFVRWHVMRELLRRVRSGPRRAAAAAGMKV